MRVVEYHLTATATASGPPADPDSAAADAVSLTYRLLTTITDPDAATAADLAQLYFQRWEIETAFGELKPYQRGPGVVLRSKLPDGALQEIYGYLCLHYAIRWLVHTTQHIPAETRTGSRSPAPSGPLGEPPPATRVFPPDTLTDAYDCVSEEILGELLPARTHRVNPRVVKRKMSGGGTRPIRAFTRSNTLPIAAHHP